MKPKHVWVVAISIMFLSGCSTENKSQVGILGAGFVDSEIVLTVILEDEYEIQLFEGDVGGNTFSTPAMEPTEVRYRIEDEKIWMGEFECNFDMEKLEWRDSYPSLSEPSRHLHIANRHTTGRPVPISLRVVKKDVPGEYKTVATLCGY